MIFAAASISSAKSVFGKPPAASKSDILYAAKLSEQNAVEMPYFSISFFDFIIEYGG